MSESSTYAAILLEGKAAEARRMLFRLGRKHLGPPASMFEAMVEAMTDVDQIEELSERSTDVSSWEELFDRP